MPIPNPENDDWLSWELIMSMNSLDNQEFHYEAMCFHDQKNNYGTKSSALIALPNTFYFKSVKTFPVFKATESSPILSPYSNVEID